VYNTTAIICTKYLGVVVFYISEYVSDNSRHDLEVEKDMLFDFFLMARIIIRHGGTSRCSLSKSKDKDGKPDKADKGKG